MATKSTAPATALVAARNATSVAFPPVSFNGTNVSQDGSLRPWSEFTPFSARIATSKAANSHLMLRGADSTRGGDLRELDVDSNMVGATPEFAAAVEGVRALLATKIEILEKELIATAAAKAEANGPAF